MVTPIAAAAPLMLFPRPVMVRYWASDGRGNNVVPRCLQCDVLLVTLVFKEELLPLKTSSIALEVDLTVGTVEDLRELPDATAFFKK